MFSHFFDLTPDQAPDQAPSLTQESDDMVSAESQTEIVIETIGKDPVVDIKYQVGSVEQITTTENTETKIPTYDDLEVIYAENITGKPHQRNDSSSLPSELYDVKYSENATEVILMGEVTELERMPRDNLDNLEPLEGAYNRSVIRYFRRKKQC